MQSFILRLPFVLSLLVGASCASTKDQDRVVRAPSDSATTDSAGSANAATSSSSRATADSSMGHSAGGSSASGRTLTTDDLKGLSWRSVGPANMGGRVADIAVAPGNPKTYYIGYGTGVQE